MENSSSTAINALLRGVSTDHVESVRDAWRELLVDRESSVRVVKLKLASSAWSRNPKGPISKYFTVLLSLLDELDSLEFAKEVERLKDADPHPLHRRTLDLLNQRIHHAPAIKVVGGVPVFVSDDIRDKKLVAENIKRWSQTRDLVLDGITRIDVIASSADLEYLGQYNIFFSGIILTWPAERPKGLRLWLRRLEAESTFYHEVGHHVMGHIEGGQVAEQEREANDYSKRMMRKSRPMLFFISRTILWPIFKIYRNLLS